MPKDKDRRIPRANSWLVDELYSIFEEEGVVSPPLVVKRAEPKDNPLHDEFTWNNSVAGHQFRLVQARRLIRRAAKAEVIWASGNESQVVEIPCLVSVVEIDNEGNGDQHYLPRAKIIEDEELLRQAISRTLGRSLGFRNELAWAAEQLGYEFLGKLVRALDRADKELGQMVVEV